MVRYVIVIFIGILWDLMGIIWNYFGNSWICLNFFFLNNSDLFSSLTSQSLANKQPKLTNNTHCNHPIKAKNSLFRRLTNLRFLV